MPSRPILRRAGNPADQSRLPSLSGIWRGVASVPRLHPRFDAGEMLSSIETHRAPMMPGADADSEGIIALCREHLAAYKVPRSVQFVADLPRTSTGKVMRRELKPSTPSSWCRRTLGLENAAKPR
jgi:acyl-CoA synthetase (AMP-forming)/AMP-acid ligase II